MKFCTALSISHWLALLCGASAMIEFEKSRRLSGQGRTLKKLLGKARRLDEGGDGGDGGDGDADMGFLADYSLKFMSCIPDQVLTDADYNDHFGVVIFRLCPSNKCSDDNGCSSGYADFAIDVGTFVDSYLEDQADNMNWDDNFDGGDFGQCTEYESQDDGTIYYIGPGCTEDGTGVKMGVYEDMYCYQESDSSFESISNGWSLPFSDGDLVSTYCTNCQADGDVREMCSDLYDASPYRCEADFGFKHYYYDVNFEMYKYGQDTTGCTKIDVMQRPRSQFSNGAVWTDAILAVMLLVVTAAGYAWYSTWWSKQKENLEKIDDDEDSQEGYHLEGEEGDGDYCSPDEYVSGGENDVNESAVNTSAESNVEKGEMA